MTYKAKCQTCASPGAVLAAHGIGDRVPNMDLNMLPAWNIKELNSKAFGSVFPYKSAVLSCGNRADHGRIILPGPFENVTGKPRH